MKNFIDKALDWVLRSSADPTQWSLTVKMALLGLVPYAMQAIGITCGVHLYCAAVDQSVLTDVALTASNIVFLALSLVAALGSAYGLIRKVVLTVMGDNAALNA